MGDTIHRSLPRGGPPERALTLWASLRVVLQGDASRKANVGYSGVGDLYQAPLPLFRRSGEQAQECRATCSEPRMGLTSVLVRPLAISVPHKVTWLCKALRMWSKARSSHSRISLELPP